MLCLWKIFENTQLNDAWEQRLGWIKSFSKYRNFDRIDGEPVELEWNIFPRFNTLQLCGKINGLLGDLGQTPELSQEEFSLCRCSTTFPVEQKTMMKNAWQMPSSFIYWSRFWKEVVLHERGQSTRNLGQSSGKDVDCFRRKRMSNFPWYDPIVQRSTQKQRTWKTDDTLCSRPRNDWDYFSHNCFCKPAQSLPFTRERCDPLWWDNQVPHSCSVWSRQKNLWIMMTWPTKILCCSNMENELRSCHNKTNRVNSVWMQDFWVLLKMDSISWRKILKNSHNSQMQRPVVSTLCQETKKHRNQKVGSEGTKIGLVLEVATCCLQGKYGVEIRIESMSRDNTHSWVRIFHK